jgi:GTPase SAR1 family protein
MVAGAGQERFLAITSTFLRRKHVVIATYSLIDLDSIRALCETWLPMCLEQCRERTLFVFVGNKLDLVPVGKTANDLGEDHDDHPGADDSGAGAGAAASETAGPPSAGGMGEGRPAMLVDALREMRRSVDKLLEAHAVAPLFFETSAVRGDNLTEFMAEVSRAVARDRLGSGRSVITGEPLEETDHAIDIDPAASKGVLGMGTCCV